jgi:hypothetical protein
MNIIFRVFDEVSLSDMISKTSGAELLHYFWWGYAIQFDRRHKVFWIPEILTVTNMNIMKPSQIDKINMNNGIGWNQFLANIPFKPIDDEVAIRIVLNFLKQRCQLSCNAFKCWCKKYKLTSQLVPNAIGEISLFTNACVSPWRTIMVVMMPEILWVQNDFKLKWTFKIEDTSWIKPMKYVGIWWEMHVGIYMGFCRLANN